jgi:Uma2 family endonuclease
LSGSIRARSGHPSAANPCLGQRHDGLDLDEIPGYGSLGCAADQPPLVYTGGVIRVADPLQKDDRQYTYADYASWPEGERWELIDGLAYDMSAAPSTRHQVVLGSLHALARAALAGKTCRAYLAPLDVLLPEAGEADGKVRSVVQPDLVVVCDPGKILPKGCRGAPDLLAEILSPSTAYKDQTRKLELYERHGVREYWVLNPETDTLLAWTLGPSGRYGKPEVLQGDETLRSTAVPGLVLSLSEVFAD